MADKIVSHIVSYNLWDEETQSMRTYDFEVALNLSKLPIKNMQRARQNDSGKSSLVHGALVIKVK